MFSTPIKDLYSFIVNSVGEDIEPYLHYTEQSNLPDIDLKMLNDGTYLYSESEIPDDLTFTMKSCESIILTAEQIKKLPHDMVSSALFHIEDRDKSIGDFFGRTGEHTLDSPSPDHMGRLACDYCLEIGTTRSSNPISYFNSKQLKYRDICRERSLQLLILIVCSQSVYSNTHIDRNTANILYNRYLLGLKIQMRAMEFGLTLNDETELSSKISKSISNYVAHQFNDPLCISMSELLDYKLRMKNKDPSEERKLYDGLINEAKDYLREVIESDEKFSSDMYIKEVNDLGTRTDMKSVAPISLFSLDGSTYPEYGDFSEDVVMGRFWTSILNNDVDDHHQDYEESKYAYFTRQEEKNDRSSRREELKIKNRVLLDVQREDEEYFALKGINGSKYSNFGFKQEKEKQSRESFRFDTDVSDIDSFIKSFDDSISQEENPFYYAHDYFISWAKEKSWNVSVLDDLINTKILSCLSCNSAIFSEINLQRLKPTKKNQWVLTKHPTLPCYIAVHNTKINNHVFYSVVFKKESLVSSYGKPFKALIDIGDAYCTEILSTNTHDISHHISSANTFISITSLFCNVWNYDLDLGLQSIPCKEEIMATILTYLENKDSSSSPLFNVRYMYMSMIIPKGLNCNPFKVLDKFPRVIRSRLLLWNLKRILTNFKLMLVKRETLGSYEPIINDDDVEDDISRDSIPGLLSYVSGNELPSFSCAVSLSYIGTYHNSDKNVKIHGFLKIFSKILKEELKIRETTIQSMKGHDIKLPSEYKSHEFSEIHIHNVSNALKTHWKKKGVADDYIRDKILKDLSKVTFSELSTFKASADSTNFNGMDDNPKWLDYKQKRRNKALEEVVKYIEEMSSEDQSPFTDMQRVVDLCREHGGIIANLFKKNQPTGPREIFVLTMFSRIMIKFLETVSRSLCDLCDNEYLTKGTEKKFSTRKHFSRVRDSMSKERTSLTVTDSCDATTWCQRFVMPVFQKMFAGVFEGWPEMLNLINDILNHVTVKRLEMPKELLDLFMKNQSIQSIDSGMTELKMQFLGNSDKNDLIEQETVLLKNRSNFMQGILHYTSSLLHAGHCLLMNDLCNEVLFKPNNMKVVQTSKVSSDDCSLLRSCIFNSNLSKSDKGRIKVLLLLSSAISQRSYPLIGALSSKEKSSVMVLCSIEEFNSMWTVVNTVISPLIKWGYESQQIQTEDDFESRFNTCYNMLSDLIENGAAVSSVKYCEYGMCMNHFNLLGMYTTKRDEFVKLLSDIDELKSPSIGYFPFSHSLIGPSLGYHFTKWFNMKTHKIARSVDYVTKKKMFGVLQSDGSHSFFYSFPIGNAKNYGKFIDRLGFDRDEISAEIEKDPSIYFSNIDGINDDIFRIKLKALGRGASKSFSFNSPAKQHASTAYILTRPSITCGFNGEELIKMTLPALIMRIKNTITMSKTNLSLETNNDFYERVTKDVDRYILKRSSDNKRKIMSSIKLDDNLQLCSLREVVQKMWFSMEIWKPKFVYMRSVIHYRSKFLWLKDTYKESFDYYRKNIGEIDHLSFCEGINNVSNKPKTCSFLHHGRQKMGKTEQLIECIVSSARVGCLATKIQELYSSRDKIDRLKNDLSRIESLLYKLSTAPPLNSRTECIKEALRLGTKINLNDCLNYETVEQLTSREKQLFFIVSATYLTETSKLQNRDLEKSNLVEMMNLGTQSYYIQEQEKVDDKYVGFGVIGLRINDLRARLYVSDDNIDLILINDYEKFKRYRRDFIRECTRIGLTQCQSDFSDYGNALRFNLKNDFLGLSTEPWTRVQIGTSFTSNDKIDFRAEIREHGSIKLIVLINGHPGDGVTFMPQRFGTDPFPLSKKYPIIDKWVRNEPIDEDMLEKIFEKAKDDYSLLLWMSRTLKVRMIALGMIPEGLYDFKPGPLVNTPEYEEVSAMSMFRTVFQEKDLVADIMKETDTMNFMDIMREQTMTREIVEDLGEFGNYDHYTMMQERNRDIDRINLVSYSVFWDPYIEVLKEIITDKSYTYRPAPEIGLMTKKLLTMIGFREQGPMPKSLRF